MQLLSTGFYLYYYFHFCVSSDFNAVALSLLFSSTTPLQCGEIGIVEDSVVESLAPEVFRLSATTAAPRVTIRPATVDILILDNEGM